MKGWGLGLGKAKRKKRKDLEDKAKRRREESKKNKELDQLTNASSGESKPGHRRPQSETTSSRRARGPAEASSTCGSSSNLKARQRSAQVVPI